MEKVAKKFKWRDGRGCFHLPSEMRTEHLFFTIRMIWNQSAPACERLYPYKPYMFGKFYSSKYLKEAIAHLLEELTVRDDLKANHRNQLYQMHRFLKQRKTLGKGHR